MRLRHITGSEKVIAESPFCIEASSELKGKWHTFFPSKQSLYVEIGMGKGQFLMGCAAANPDINYIGFERYDSVLLRAVQKMEGLETPLPNLKFVCADAANLAEYFAEGEIDRIYLNFSDPWPKDRHAKRRLTSDRFWPIYDKILAEGGQLEFKTDNQGLFTFSVETVEHSDIWMLKTVTRDLHHDEKLCQGNIMTEYEEKFSSQGNPICKLIAVRKNDLA